MARSLRSILLRRAGSRSNIVVLDAIGANKAFFVGNSMGGFATLHIGMRHPDRVLGLVAAGCRYGAHPDQEATFRAEARKLADSFRDDGSEEVASWYGFAPARLQMLAKDPQGHAEHIKVLGEHDRIGASNTMRWVQAERPSMFDRRPERGVRGTSDAERSGDGGSPQCPHHGPERILAGEGLRRHA